MLRQSEACKAPRLQSFVSAKLIQSLQSKENAMVEVKAGQCGMCAHFGEGHEEPAVVEIRQSGQAPDNLVEIASCRVTRRCT